MGCGFWAGSQAPLTQARSLTQTVREIQESNVNYLRTAFIFQRGMFREKINLFDK